MKTRLFAILLVAAVLGFNACGSKGDDKSSACDITSFTVNGVSYDISGLNITKNYQKTLADTWNPAWPGNSVAPAVQVSPGADYTPKGNITIPTTGTIDFTVTAEDGTTKKVYKVSVTRQETL